MSIRRRSTSLAMAGALVTALVLSGAAFAADLAREAATVSTTPFVDADGNGVADGCQDVVIADPTAAAAAEAAVDANGDGTISVDEAAHSDRAGGANCNHGGYVSGVARAQCDDGSDGDATGPTEQGDQPDQSDQTDGATATLTAAVAPAAEGAGDQAPDGCQDETTPTADAAPTTPCVATVVPTFDPTADTSPGAFGRYVASVAQSDAVGGKDCNHGGAVSTAVHAAQAAAKAARDAAKAERAAARDAAKALRILGHAGKGHGHGHGH